MKKTLLLISVLILLLIMSSCKGETNNNMQETTTVAQTESTTTEVLKEEKDCTHEFGEWQTVTEATSDMGGKEIRTCALCGIDEERETQPVIYLPNDWADMISSISKDENMPTELYYMQYATSNDRTQRNGTPVAVESDIAFKGVERSWAEADEIPKSVSDVFVAALDPLFYQRTQTLGAAAYYLADTDEYSVSPITLALVRNITSSNPELPIDKIKEVRTAFYTEQTLGKDGILEYYLNTLVFSDSCVGVETAARVYFGKSLFELDTAHTAALAVMSGNNTVNNIKTAPEENKTARNALLNELVNSGVISDEEYETAINTSVAATEAKSYSQDPVMSWYTEEVFYEAISLLSTQLSVSEDEASAMIEGGGLKIYTVMDPEIQQILTDFYKDPANFTSIGSGTQPQSAMVIVDPTTGDILGLVGARGEKSSNAISNYASKMKRSPGSSIKPLAVYGPALEYGIINYSTIIEDSPYSGDWPSNYPEGYNGPTQVNDAVRRSVNTVAVKVLMKLGVTRSYEFAHDKLGVTSIVRNYTNSAGEYMNDLNASALGLGGMLFGVTVREMAGAYQVFANQGTVTGNRTVLKITDAKGNVLVDNEGTPSQPMTAENAAIMTKMLESVVDSGTASTITLDDKVNCAGKTGTTSYDMDRWFMGYTPYYIGGVWFGYANHASLEGFSEVRSPAIDVWDKVMTKIHDTKVFDTGEEIRIFNLPETVEMHTTCMTSGDIATSRCRSTRLGYFTANNKPTEYCKYH